MTDSQRPDEIAHRLVTNVGSPVRVYLDDGQATIPVEPCRGVSPATTTVPLEYFDAVIENALIEDGGLTLFCMDGLHLPESEWCRSGLDRHWRDGDADLEDPFFPPQRKLEVWASREDALYDADEPYGFSHLDGIPDDSPIFTEWVANASDEYPDRPPVPFDRPTVSVRAVRAEGVTDVQGFDRVDVGQIARIELLDELSEQPSAPDIEPRDVDFSPPSRHPEIDYDEIDPLPQSNELLEAVFTINRHAKRLDEEADTAYQRGDGAEARVCSLRKRALYRTKTVALHRFSKSDPDAIRVVGHELNGDHELLCFYVGTYSYHQPIAAVNPNLLAATTGSDDLSEIKFGAIDFESSAETGDLDMSLSQAIGVLRDHGIEPNDYLDATQVEDFTWGSVISTTFAER
ncbi:hypothetical protein [Halegenticoccus soli]|uniref:hypothetical protein n=1 Tax=Halegenticoccus soli TaxID=1985678 RepID=UPI0018ECF531|nr:hypothetical protein [Halegenticoccus soli]